MFVCTEIYALTLSLLFTMSTKYVQNNEDKLCNFR